MEFKTKQKGFTLIEILLALTIIGLISGLALVSFGGARKTSRDAKRKADLEQIRSALEMYKADKKVYPSNLSGLVPDYLVEIPADPVTGFQYGYLPVCTGSPTLICGLSVSCEDSLCCAYQLTADLEASEETYQVCNP